MYIYIYISMHIYVRTYIFIYIYIYIWTWLIHIFDMTRSWSGHDVFIYGTWYVTWLINRWHDSFTYGKGHDSIICETGHDSFICYMGHDSFICDMGHDTFIYDTHHKNSSHGTQRQPLQKALCETWPIHDSFMYDTSRIHIWHGTWLIHMWYVTWLIHIWYGTWLMTHSCMRHHAFTYDTHIIHIWHTHHRNSSHGTQIQPLQKAPRNSGRVRVVVSYWEEIYQLVLKSPSNLSQYVLCFLHAQFFFFEYGEGACLCVVLGKDLSSGADVAIKFEPVCCIYTYICTYICILGFMF